MNNTISNTVRVFTDVHHNSVARPVPQGDDLYIDVDGTGVLNPSLSALTGWNGVPSHIRAGWHSRSIKTYSGLNVLSSSGFNPYRSAIAENGIAISVSLYGEIRKFDLKNSLTSSVSVFSDPAESFINVKYAGNGVFYVSGRRNSRITVFKSSNYGITWSEIYYAPVESGEGRVLAVKNEVELIVSSSMFYTAKSINGGSSWINVGDKGDGYISEATYANGNYFFAGYTGMLDSYIAKSSDGVTFTTVHSVPNGGRIRDIVFVSDMVGFACGCKTTANFNTKGFILRTTDGGNTWNEVYYNPNFGIGGIAFKNSQEVYFACSYNTTSYLGGIITFDAGSTFQVVNSIGTEWFILNRPIYYNDSYLHVSENICEFSPNVKLKIGEQNCKRFGFFHIRTNPVQVIAISHSNISVLEINLQLKRATTGTGKFYGMLYFVDAYGFPIAMTANIGFGAKRYIGWGVEYVNNAGNITIKRLVAIEEFNYPVESTPANDDIVTVADTLLDLPETTITVEQLSNIRIIPTNSVVYNNVYTDDGNGEPDLSINPLISNEILLPESVKYMITSYRFTTGMIGEGGAGSNDGEGLIDNFAVRWA